MPAAGRHSGGQAKAYGGFTAIAWPQNCHYLVNPQLSLAVRMVLLVSSTGVPLLPLVGQT